MRPRGRKALTVVHVLGSASNLGVIVTAGALVAVSASAAASADPAGARQAARMAAFCVSHVGVPLLSAAVVTGIVSALASPWRLFRTGWVVKKLGLTLANVILAAAVVAPRAAGVPAGGADLWLAAAGLTAQLILSVLATVLSVVKPRGKSARAAPIRTGRAPRTEVET